MIILLDNGHGFDTSGKRSPDGHFREYAFNRSSGASVVDDVLQIRRKLDAVDSDSRYRLLTKVQLVRPGAGRNPGKMINYLAEGSANDPHVTSFIPAYKVVSGLDLDSYQVHARCILLDTETGYRSQFLAVSGVVNLS